MAIVIRSANLFWAKLDANAPVNPFNAAFPHWEVQIRTSSKDEAKTWKDHGMNVTPKDDDAGIFYQVNLKSKAFTNAGKPRKPVTVVDGELMPLDPTIIGNGSVGNVQLDSYEYTMNGNKGIGFSIKAIQVTKLIEFKSTGGLDFENEGVTEIVVPSDTNEDDSDW